MVIYTGTAYFTTDGWLCTQVQHHYKWMIVNTDTANFTDGWFCIQIQHAFIWMVIYTQVQHALQMDGYVHRYIMLYRWVVIYISTACPADGWLCTHVHHA